MPRKKRSDSNSAAVEVIQNIMDGPPQVPAEADVPPEAMAFWSAIINSKDYAMWTPSDLVIAADLARVSYEIEEYSKMVTNHRRLLQDGDKVTVSPVHKILLDLQNYRINLCRTLQIHARATHGESQHQNKRNRLFFESKHTVQNSEAQSLIAMPNRKQ